MMQILTIVLIFSVASIVVPEPYYPDNLSLKQLVKIADVLELKFQNLHQKHSFMDLLPKNDSKLVVEDVESETLMQSMAFRIHKLFKDKQKALKQNVKTLEEASKHYKWHNNLESNFSNVVFLNASTEKDLKYNSTMDDLFGVQVVKSVTGVHVPLEIFEGYPEIVNGLNWSSSVDQTFKLNTEEDNTLGWQYFAAESGFMRLYPAVTKWYIPPPYNTVDLFDARRRPWYIQGSVSPKDVIILIDRSGSVHGQTFSIMKFAVETLIDTLGEDDFVNIAAFNETTSWISEIVYKATNSRMPPEYQMYNESLIQASNINKKALIGDIKQLTVRGIANYTDALDFAFRNFKKRAHNSETSSFCHKLIMFFSDGGTEWPQEVIDRYMNDTDTMDIRIFTYAIGPHPIPTAVMKQMACETGGKHTVITTSSAVRMNIQDYLFTLASNDSTEYDLVSFTYQQDHLTQNLTISITLPVFNLSDALGPDEQQLAGVAGVDIPIQLIENFVPRETLGPIGYTYLINHNGFLIFHPRLHSQQSYLQDPPHLDFLDLELNVDDLKLSRNQMVQGDRNGIAVRGKLLLDKNHIIDKVMMKYTFMPIHDSPYSLGMVTLLGSKHLTLVEEFIIGTIDPITSILAPWDFCGIHGALPKSDLLNKRIISNGEKCNKLLLNSVMWAQEWTNNLIKIWQSNADIPNNITSRAIYTRFGLARVVAGRFEENGSIGYVHPFLGSEWRDPQQNPALKRGMITDDLSIFPHINGAFLSKPVTVNSIKAAVIGINITSELLDHELFDAIEEITPFNTSIIMLIDEGAYIISSSQYERSSGEFLGDRWPMLLEKLEEAGIYNRENVTDYQATCQGHADFYAEYSSGSRLNFFFQPLKVLGNLVFQAFIFIQYICVHCFVPLSTSPSVAEAIHHRVDQKESCVLQQAIFYLNDTREFSGNISCMGDSAQILVRRMNNMNAIIVAVDESLLNLDCDGWGNRKIVMPDEIVTDSDFITMIYPKELASRVPRDRRKPEKCNKLQRTERPKCNSASHVAVSMSLFWICAMFLRL